MDFLHGHCCSCSGSASDCVATDGDNNNDAVSSSDVVGIFIDVVVGSKMILMLMFILVGAVSSGTQICKRMVAGVRKLFGS